MHNASLELCSLATERDARIISGGFCDNLAEKLYLCSVKLKTTSKMETTKKRTREEVRAAFRAFMREKEEERKAAQARLEVYHQKRLAGLV